MVPDDEVEALAGGYVISAVAPRPQVHDARADAMVVRVLVAPVVRRADHPTEDQTTPLEVPPEADVERHCEGKRASCGAVSAPSHRPSVVVWTSVTVLVGAVLHDEGMCRVEARRRVAPVVCRKKFPRERQQHEPLRYNSATGAVGARISFTMMP